MTRTPPHVPRASRHRSPRGAVLVLALLSLMLLAAAVFYIFNVGQHLQRRTETQNAADAAAISGANWMARSLNSVAMNNVEITRLLAMVQVLDAIPQAVEFSLADHRAALEGIDRQIDHPVPGEPWLTTGLENVVTELQRQIATLSEMNNALGSQGYDIAELTFYNGPNGRGKLWRAMENLDTINQATMQNLGDLAQLSAARAAQENQSDPAARGFLVPFVPTVPWQRGTFEDFKRPTMEGILPLGTDDRVVRRGPFDVVFGWRIPEIETRFAPIDYDQQLEEDYPFGGFRRPGREAVSGDVIGYKNYGPFDFFLGQLNDAERDALGSSPTYGPVRSWFADRAQAYARSKMNALFPPTQAPTIADALWINDYDTVQARKNQGRNVFEMFIYLEFSSVPVDATGHALQTPVMTDWGFFPFELPAGFNPLGGADPDAPNAPVKVADHVWRMERILFTTDDATGDRTVYRQFAYLVWCAGNLGNEMRVRNPNPPDTADDALPAPIDLIHADMEFNDPEAKDAHLRFFAAADQSAQAALWPALFDAKRPAQRVTATAAAEVFNNHSWDLWTQMWHAKLSPVGDLDPWLDLMQKTGSATETSPWLDPDEVGETYRYLRTVAPLLETIRQEGR